MAGDGIGLDGRQYHIDSLGSGGWLTAGGGNGASAPFWRTGGFWRSSGDRLTFGLATGAWSEGSHIYIPVYAAVNDGWFEADDTSGAIIGRQPGKPGQLHHRPARASSRPGSPCRDDLGFVFLAVGARASPPSPGG